MDTSKMQRKTIDLSDFFALLENLKVVEKKDECIKLKYALNRILSNDIKSKYDIPRFDNSAMDGYAIKLGFSEYRLKDTAFAGDKAKLKINNNEAIRITTGAKIPKNTQAVIPKEKVRIEGDRILLETNPTMNQCIKFRGEDYKSGKVILPRGTKLDAGSIALLASQGINKIKVKKRVKAIIFGSGNEIANIDKKLSQNQIYDINSYFLRSIFGDLNIKIKYGGILGDKIKVIRDRILKALDKYDIIITSGGVSKGKKDYMREVLQSINANILLESTNIKPGSPVIFARKGDCGESDSKKETLRKKATKKYSKKNDSFILSLPGNPIAAFIQCKLHLPLLVQKLSGNSDLYLKPIVAINKDSFKTTKNTSHIILGHYENGYFTAYNHAKYQGAQIAPLLKSNAFAIIDDKNMVEKDSKIKILLYSPHFFDKINDMFN